MAGIDVGAGGKRALNQELPLIPFIDFLLCLVAFLLITAVWNQAAVVEANALVPQQADPDPVDPPDEKPLLLHVEMTSNDAFNLVWKRGHDTVSDLAVPPSRASLGQNGDFMYAALAEAVTQQWRIHGEHRQASDPRLDHAVLHVDDSKNFEEVVAVIDAI